MHGGHGGFIMAWTTWAIIILLALSYYQYVSPEKANSRIEPVYGPVQDFIGAKVPFMKGESCPDTNDPVCGVDLVTYANTCLAAEAGQTQVTAGACMP